MTSIEARGPIDVRIAAFQKRLFDRFPKFNHNPVPAQMAMTDMTFNLGTAGLLTKFPAFKRTVEVEDWAKTAAAESNRFQVSLARNTQVKSWLNEAAQAKP